MDKVFIRDLRIEAVIGVFDWEKAVKQPLIFDLDMAWNIKRAAETDNLDYALNYQAVAEFVEAFLHSQQFELLEAMLDKLAAALMSEFGIPWLRICVEKPAVVPQARVVGISIERGDAQA